MKLLEKYEGIKCVSILPGAVDSPLWSQEKRDRVKFDKVESLKPDDVAKAMIDLVRPLLARADEMLPKAYQRQVQDGKYGGGTLLEIMPNNGPKVGNRDY